MDTASTFLLAAFGGACVLLLASGLRRRSGVFEFPFLAGGGLLAFLFPQALGLVTGGDPAPHDGMVRALLMSTLCALAIYVGWREKTPERWSAPADREYPLRRLYGMGLGALAIGLAGFLKLVSLSGGIAAHYSTHGNYALEWKGMPVVYDFFSLFLIPGLLLCGLAGLAMGSKLRLIAPTIALTVHLAAIVFLGRRLVLVSVALSIGCLLYFGKGWAPPRRLALAPLLAVAIWIAPEYRKHSQIGGDIERLREMDFHTLLGAAADGGQHEFWAMANYIHATTADGLYECGAGVYNIWVILFVPKLIVGEAGKAAMMIPTRAAAGGWQMPYGMVPTGPGSAYRQFWFYGCVWFYGLSRWMRYLWLRAGAGDRLAQAGYMFLLTPAVTAVVSDMFAIYTPLFLFWIPLAVLTGAIFPGPRACRRQAQPRRRPLSAAVAR